MSAMKCCIVRGCKLGCEWAKIQSGLFVRVFQKAAMPSAGMACTRPEPSAMQLTGQSFRFVRYQSCCVPGDQMRPDFGVRAWRVLQVGLSCLLLTSRLGSRNASFAIATASGLIGTWAHRRHFCASCHSPTPKHRGRGLSWRPIVLCDLRNMAQLCAVPGHAGLSRHV